MLQCSIGLSVLNNTVATLYLMGENLRHKAYSELKEEVLSISELKKRGAAFRYC